MVTFINGEFVDEKAAMLHVSDLSIQRGYGIFDFFRTNQYTPLFLSDYLNRFYRSAKGLRLNVPYNAEELSGIIGEMINRNGIGSSGFRMILTGGYSIDSYEPAAPNLVLIQQPLTLPDEQKINKGLSVILHEHMRELPSIKSINYLVGIWLQDKIREQGADEVLYTKDGFVLEFPRSNVFIITEDNTVVTPASNVLDGITRMKVLELAKRKFITEVREIRIDELVNAKEVFLTSTTKRLLPVLKVNGRLINEGKPGKVVNELLRDFIEMENAHCATQNSQTGK